MPEYILAIDPGNEYSAYALIKADDYTPVQFEKLPNDKIRTYLRAHLQLCNHTELVIEKVACYGMPVGAEVLETCLESGRFVQIAADQHVEAHRVFRATVKTMLCGTPRAKDSNVIQALKDRFGEKGTKKNPGWFYGFKADCWQAYALGVAWLDENMADSKKT